MMKQKIIIGFSVALLLLAVFLIARDLFRKPASPTEASCCGDDYTLLKKIDSSLLGYTRVKIIETNLKDLSGIAVDENQTIYVCGNRLVAVFDSTGRRTNRFSTDTAANCIALNGNDLYLGMGPQIAHYKSFGKRISVWKTSNTPGFITSIAINGNHVYAADAISKRILKYTTEGNFVQEIGRKDSLTSSPGFIIPSLYFDIAFGAFNDLWAVNPGKLSVENFTPSGHMQSAWGKVSSANNGFTGCCNPAHMSILPDGSFVTYEKGIDKIKVFDPTGSFLCLVGGAGSFKGNADFQLGNISLVKDMAAGNDGNIYVLDAFNRINVFKKKDI
jgi:hypothetical protein